MADISVRTRHIEKREILLPKIPDYKNFNSINNRNVNMHI